MLVSSDSFSKFIALHHPSDTIFRLMKTFPQNDEAKLLGPQDQSIRPSMLLKVGPRTLPKFPVFVSPRKQSWVVKSILFLLNGPATVTNPLQLRPSNIPVVSTVSYEFKTNGRNLASYESGIDQSSGGIHGSCFSGDLKLPLMLPNFLFCLNSGVFLINWRHYVITTCHKRKSLDDLQSCHSIYTHFLSPGWWKRRFNVLEWTAC